MFFKVILSIFLGLVALKTLHGMGLKPRYLFLGTVWGAAVGLTGWLDYTAIKAGSEGWGFMSFIVSVLTLFGTGFFIQYIGDTEGWW